MAASRWSRLPRPLRIGLGILAFVFLLGFSQQLGSVPLLLAGVLWVAAVVGVLHASDQCPWLDRYPAVSRVLSRYAPRPGGARVVQPASPGPDTPTADVPQAPDVSHFVGLDDVWQKIHTLLDSTSEVTSTVQPATLVLLVGQKGTGKSSVSSALAVELYKRRIVTASHVETISVTNTPGLVESYGPTPDASHALSDRIQKALDGVLRIEDIDATTAVSTGPAIATLGAQLLTVARTYPGRLFVLCTGSPGAVVHLNNCVGQLNVHRIDFETLSDEALYDLFVQLVDTHGLRLAEHTEGTLKYKIQEIKDEQGNAFENAYTLHKLFDQVNYARGLRVRQSPDLPERERQVIQREDMQQATLMQ